MIACGCLPGACFEKAGGVCGMGCGACVGSVGSVCCEYVAGVVNLYAWVVSFATC